MGVNNIRLAWLDNSKMFAMLCVFIYHVGSFTYIGQISGAIESFNMPLFMMLSGYASLPSLMKKRYFVAEWYQYVKKHFVRIMVPCLFVSAWSLPWSHDAMFFLHEYWFLHCLFTMIVGFAFCCWINRLLASRMNIWIPIVILNIAFIFITRNNLSEMISYFSCGLLFRKYDILNKLFRVPFKYRVAVICGGAILWWFLYSNYYRSFYMFPLIENLQGTYIFVIRHIAGLLMSISLILLIEICSRKYSEFSYWGTKTLGLYLIHVFIVDYIINNNGFKISSTGSFLIDVAVALLVVLLLCVVSIYVCKLSSKYHLLRMLILGEK